MSSAQSRPQRPPVVVASVFQTGLNLMRDLLAEGLHVVGIDCEASNPGFISSYGKSFLGPNPDTHPEQWVEFMIGISRSLPSKPVIIPAADIFVSALGAHAEVLKDYFIFSLESIAVQAALATKEQQYALAESFGLPVPRTAYVRSLEDLQAFAATARFPCLLKPRHQREWDVLAEGNKLRGLKLSIASNPDELFADYAHASPHRPEVMVQEIIAGGDDAKFCYLSVYGRNGKRLGHCVVHELRASPILFGSGSIVEPVVDADVAAVCDSFLRKVNYVGICEIEVKRDTRDGVVRLIEANPRFSVTADAAIYAGVNIGLLHYLDLIGENVEEVQPSRFNFRHVVWGREASAITQLLRHRLITVGGVWRSFRGPLRSFDFSLRDPRPTWRTVKGCFRILISAALYSLGVRRAGFVRNERHVASYIAALSQLSSAPASKKPASS